MTKNTTDRLPLLIYRLKTYFISGQCEVSFSLRQLNKRLKLSFLTPNLVTCYRAEQNRTEQNSIFHTGRGQGWGRPRKRGLSQGEGRKERIHPLSHVRVWCSTYNRCCFCPWGLRLHRVVSYPSFPLGNTQRGFGTGGPGRWNEEDKI